MHERPLIGHGLHLHLLVRTEEISLKPSRAALMFAPLTDIFTPFSQCVKGGNGYACLSSS